MTTLLLIFAALCSGLSTRCNDEYGGIVGAARNRYRNRAAVDGGVFAGRMVR